MNVNLKSEKNRILKLSKKILDREEYKRLKRIYEEEDFSHIANYAIINSMEKDMHYLEKKIKRLESIDRDVFFVKNKFLKIKPRINAFKASNSNEEFYKVLNLTNEIKKEIDD